MFLRKFRRCGGRREPHRSRSVGRSVDSRELWSTGVASRCSVAESSARETFRVRVSGGGAVGVATRTCHPCQTRKFFSSSAPHFPRRKVPRNSPHRRARKSRTNPTRARQRAMRQARLGQRSSPTGVVAVAPTVAAALAAITPSRDFSSSSSSSSSSSGGGGSGGQRASEAALWAKQPHGRSGHAGGGGGGGGGAVVVIGDALRSRLAAYDAHVTRVHAARARRGDYAWRHLASPSSPDNGEERGWGGGGGGGGGGGRRPNRLRAWDHYTASTEMATSDLLPAGLLRWPQIHCGGVPASGAALRDPGRPLTLEEMRVIGVPATCADLIDRAQCRNL